MSPGIPCLALWLALAACRAAPIVESTADLPWQGLHLYRSGHAWVYAAGERDADEAAVLVETAAVRFHERSGREALGRLLVVADDVGWVPGTDLHGRLGLLQAGAAVLGRPATAGAATGTSTARGSGFTTLEELSAVAADMHVEPRVLLTMSFHPLSLAQLSADFGLPAEVRSACDSAVLLPTRALTARAIEETTDALLRAQVPFAARLLVAPYMPFARRKAVRGVLEQQGVLVFELFAHSVPDWTAAERAQCVEAYRASLADPDEALEPAALTEADAQAAWAALSLGAPEPE